MTSSFSLLCRSLFQARAYNVGMALRTQSLDPNRVTVDPQPVAIRVIAGDETIANTKRGLVVREKDLPPRYYIPPGDVRMELLEPTSEGAHCPFKGDWRHWNLRLGQRLIQNAGW